MFNQLLKMLKKSLGKAALAFRSAGSQKYYTAQIKRLGYLTFQSQADYRDYLFSFESRATRPWK